MSIEKKTNEVLVKILKIGVFFVAFIPLIIFKDFISPFHFGKVIIFRSIIEFMAIFYFILVLRDKSYLPKKHPLLIIFGSWVALFGITTATSINPYLSFWGSLERMGGLWTFAHYFLFFIILISVFRKREDWLRLLKVTIFVGFLSAIYGFGQKTNIEFFIGSGGRIRIFGTIGNAALFGGYQLVNLFLAITLLFSSWIPKNQKKYFAVAALTSIIAVSMTAVRGAILGTAVGIVLFAFLYAFTQKSHYAKYAKNVFLGLVILSFLFLGSSFAFKNSKFIKSSGYLIRMTDISFQSYTVKTRFWAWQAGIKGWVETPKTVLLGWGPENFNVPFSKYFNPQFYQGPGSETLFDRAHNMFVETLVTMGLLTLLAYIAMFFVAFRLIWKFIIYVPRKIPESGLSEKHREAQRTDPIIGIGLISLLTAYVIHNFFFFDTSANFIVFFTVLGFIYYLTCKTPSKNLGGQASQESNIYKNGHLSAGLWSLMFILLIFISVLIYKTNILPAKANYATTRAIVRGWAKDYQGAFDKYREALSYNVHGKYEIRHRFAQYVLTLTNSREIGDAEKELIKFAIQEVQKNVQETNQDYVPYLYLSRLNVILGKKDPQSQYNDIALENSLKAIEISPTFIRTYYEIAQAYLNRKDYPRALEYFEKVAELNPDIGLSYWYLGVTYFQNGDLEKGLQAVETADEKGYAFSESDYLRLISVYLELKDFKKLSEIYEALIKINPQKPQYFASIAVAYANIGEIDKAVGAARQAVLLDKNFELEARAFIENLGRKY